jgi:hypothetical protein
LIFGAPDAEAVLLIFLGSRRRDLSFLNCLVAFDVEPSTPHWQSIGRHWRQRKSNDAAVDELYNNSY